MSAIHAQRRPVIAPIKTDTSCFSDGPRRFSSHQSGSYSGIPRSRLNSLSYAQDVMHPVASPMRRNFSDASEMVAHPYVFVSRQVCPTPMSEISPHTKVWPAVYDTHATRPRHMSIGHGEVYRQTTARVPRGPYTRASRRQSIYTPDYRIRNRSIVDAELQRSQRHRLSLWEQGHKIFGRPEEADVLVKPLQLKRPLREIRSWSEEPCSAPPSSQRVVVRAVVRSKSRAPIAMKREFNLTQLRATVLDPPPGPQSSDFNHEVLLSRLQLSDEDIESKYPVDAEMADDGDDDDVVVVVKKEHPDMPPFLDRPQFVLKASAIPMSLQYARLQLPGLAAIMLSGRVRRGDTIELAMPHPSAWPATAVYIYTGERELLTQSVKENIMYLGGKF
ncbi:hypothetical protein ACQKWADRAFT_92216 [Trichoderma austrokoningii]